MLRAALLLVAFAIAGCAGITPATDAGLERRVGQTPQLGELASATVGDPVLTTFDYLVARRAVTQVEFSRAIGINRMHLPSGTPLFRAMVGGQEGWCSTGFVYFAALEGRPMCFFDPSGASAQGGRFGTFTQGYVARTARGTEVEVNIPYRILEVPSGNGSRQELLYQGLDRGVLRLSYREFAGDLARPAFTQDLTYTLEPRGRPTQIAFRNARVEVIDASNNQVLFRVITHLR